MWIGIDFGTSYSAAAAIIDGNIVNIKFDGQDQFRTAAYFASYSPTIQEFEITPAIEVEIKSLIASSRRQQNSEIKEYEQRLIEAQKAASESNGIIFPVKPLIRSDETLEKEALKAVRTAWFKKEHEKEQSISATSNETIFGDSAIDAFLDNPRGKLVQSPKSMLGYNLYPGVEEELLKIVTQIFIHIRSTASIQLNQEITGVILGRPVNFKSSMGLAGNEQACSMLTRAANMAGFSEVEFMLEPEAAALDYHQTVIDQSTILVVDIGGGTTDICLAQVGAEGTFKPMATWGSAIGGNEVDLWLNLINFMPYFGRGIITIPDICFSEAAKVTDFIRQAKFQSYDFSRCDEPYRSRIFKLQKIGATIRISRAVERLKIFLSTHNSGTIRLSKIEDDFVVTANKSDLIKAASYFILHTGTLLDRVAEETNQEINCVVLTGGASAAPYIENEILKRFPKTKIVRSNPVLGVVSGLAWSATQKA